MGIGQFKKKNHLLWHFFFDFQLTLLHKYNKLSIEMTFKSNQLIELEMMMIILQISGIDQILPCMKIDDYLFEPCGYSMNGILKNESIDFGLVNIRLFCSIQTKFYSCKLLFFEYTYIFFMYVLILNTVNFVHIGRIYDYSHHSRTGIFICQLRE